MTLLKSRERFLILLDGSFKLLNVLGSSFAKGCLSLTIALLTLLRRSIYLPEISHDMEYKGSESLLKTYGFPAAFAFLGLSGFLGSWFGARVLLRRRFYGAGSAIWRRLDLGRDSHLALEVVAISHLCRYPVEAVPGQDVRPIRQR